MTNTQVALVLGIFVALPVFVAALRALDDFEFGHRVAGAMLIFLMFAVGLSLGFDVLLRRILVGEDVLESLMFLALVIAVPLVGVTIAWAFDSELI